MTKKLAGSLFILLLASFLLLNQMDLSYTLKQTLIVLYVVAYGLVSYFYWKNHKRKTNNSYK
ncbi:hypothetical protein [Exiguobacterium sp. S22-S28]|uniref:hypothetical protein n=1 Tax=Exiguobacterium sp. S22-S28 TaxID=3342768 RepID=UPI00372D7F31